MLGPLSRWMVFEDPPAHTRLRSLVAPAFTARGVAALAGRVRELTDELLDAFVQERHDDLLHHLAVPLPAIVIAELLGVPPARRVHARTAQAGPWRRSLRPFVRSSAAMITRACKRCAFIFRYGRCG